MTTIITNREDFREAYAALQKARNHESDKTADNATLHHDVVSVYQIREAIKEASEDDRS